MRIKPSYVASNMLVITSGEFACQSENCVVISAIAHVDKTYLQRPYMAHLELPRISTESDNLSAVAATINIEIALLLTWMLLSMQRLPFEQHLNDNEDYF